VHDTAFMHPTLAQAISDGNTCYLALSVVKSPIKYFFTTLF
jgi:hypothetical protein